MHSGQPDEESLFCRGVEVLARLYEGGDIPVSVRPKLPEHLKAAIKKLLLTSEGKIERRGIPSATLLHMRGANFGITKGVTTPR